MANNSALGSKPHEATQAGVGTAHLSESDEDDEFVTVHGVALGAGDVTVGSSGIKKKWPGEELKDAAESLEGKPVVRDHENNVDGTVGTVTSAHYREGVGVLYEAEIASHYDELIQDIEAGLLEVSARAYHTDTEELEEDDDTGALLVENVYFDNLSIVSQGASPSNTLEAGEATAMAQGPNGASVAVMEEGSPRMGAAELAEEFGRSDSDPEESEEELYHGAQCLGDLVEWGDQMGIVTGVIVEDNVEKYQIKHISVTDDGTIDLGNSTSTVIAESTDPVYRHTLDKKAGNDEMEVSVDLDGVDELASFGLHAPEYSGTTTEVSGDGRVTKSDFESDNLGEISEHFLLSDSGFPPDTYSDLKLPIVTPDGDLSLPKLRAAKRSVGSVNGLDADLAVDVLMMINRLIMSEFPSEPLTSDLEQGDLGTNVEHLAGTAIHTPEFSDTTTGSWDEPALEDFTDNSWNDLSQEMKSGISDHYIVSKSGEFPPEDFGDLALPVVEPNGNLNLSALQNAKARAGQVGGVSSSDEEEINNLINRLANENFDVTFGEDEESEDAGASMTNEFEVATLSYDDPATTSESASTDGVATVYDIGDNTNMTNQIQYEEASDDDLDDMDEPVVLEKDDVESLREKAEQAESVDEHLEDVNSTLDDLAEAREELEQIDEDILDDVKEADDPVVIESDEHDELHSLVDDVSAVFAEELAEYSPFEAEELQDKFTPTELREKVEDHEEASIEAELNESTEDPDPKGGSPSEEELAEPEDDEPSEEAVREKIAEQLSSDGLDRQAQKVRDGKIGLDELGVDVEQF